jgi:phage-related minor tail protein
MQNGLNASDDFIDSIAEYGNLFSEAGFSAEQMYSIMATGAQTGVLGTDKIADAVKEMGIRLNEGGDDVVDAFDKIGLSFDEVAFDVSGPYESWAGYFDMIVGGLTQIEDPMERVQAQTAIFGTMAEDLGPSFTEFLDSAAFGLEDMSQATEALNAQYDNWPSMWEGAKRGALLALEPLGDVLLNIGNEILPVVQDAFERITAWMTENLPPAIERAKEIVADLKTKWEENFGGIRDFVLGVWQAITEQFEAFKKLFSGDLEGFGKGILTSWETIWNTVVNFIGKIWPLVEPHLKAFWKALVDWFTSQDWKQIGLDIIEFITDKLSEFWDWAKPHLEAFWKALVDWFNDQDWAEHGRNIVTAIVDALTTFADFIGPKLDAWYQAFVDWVGRVDWKGIATTIVTTVIAGLSWFLDKVGAELAKWYKAFTDWAQDNVTWENIGYWITKAILAAIAAMKDLDKKLMEVWRSIKKWFDDQPWDEHGDTVVEKIKEGLGELWTKIKESFENLWNELVSWFTEEGKFEAFGKNIIDGLKAGIQNGIQSVLDILGQLTGGIDKALEEGLEESSPSRMAARHGKSIPEGLAKGILDNVKILFDRLES